MFNLDLLIKGLDIKRILKSVRIEEPEEYTEIPYGFFENDKQIPKIYREQAKYGTSSLRRAFGVVWKHKKQIQTRADARYKKAKSIPGSKTAELEEDFSFNEEELR